MKPRIALKNKLKSGSSAFGLALMLATVCYGQATMPVDGLTAAQALPTAGPGRPAAVPADYVITPFGYFHPSCVMNLGNGDEVRQDENSVRHSNGTYDRIPLCEYAHYEGNGEAVIGDEQGLKKPTIGHAWVEAAATRSTHLVWLYVRGLDGPASTEQERRPSRVPLPRHGG